MYIGKAAQLAGTTIKAIRHYEAIGLLPRRSARVNTGCIRSKALSC